MIIRSKSCSKFKLTVFMDYFYISVFLVLVFINFCHAKPTFSYMFPSTLSFSPLSHLAKYVGATNRQESNDISKQFSGMRVSNDTLQMVYFHDQTIAVVELGPNKLLMNCELVEIVNDDDGKEMLKELTQHVNKPLGITFKEMLKLMEQCQSLESPEMIRTRRLQNEKDTAPSKEMARGLLNHNPLTLFSGIIPGTKWCGTGDIAVDYHDLGLDRQMDKCCRTHDLCPVKVRAYQQRYNLTNNSLYTKSHCTCDDMLFDCLKDTNTSASEVMGNIYFNLVQVPCVTDLKSRRTFRTARKGF